MNDNEFFRFHFRVESNQSATTICVPVAFAATINLAT